MSADSGTGRDLLDGLGTPQERSAAGAELHALAATLYPICRSITGDGVRETFSILGERLPLEVTEVPSGTAVFDWEVPPEWNVRGAWIDRLGADGEPVERVVDLADHTLHLVSYSVPVRARMPLAELRDHLHTLPEQPDLVPYRTSYYAPRWGFCLPHRVAEALPEAEYEVVVDSDLDASGSLTYAECVLPGESDGEVLVSCHSCHPSLANDNCSGLAVTAFAAARLAALPRRRYTWRFLWAPGTIGAITWLARNEARAERIVAGLVAANLGDPGAFHYKRSRRGDGLVDRAAEHVLAHRLPGDETGEEAGGEPRIEDFVPFGYDERQYGSPGFDLPVGSLTRTPWGRYPEYHTSADDLTLVRPEALAGSLARYLGVAAVLEGNRRYRNLNPKCEPQLGRRGLYSTLGGGDEGRDRQLALLWVLNLSDGEHDLLAVARRSGMRFERVREAADRLLEAGLLEEV